jgi:hypothetical protein
MVSFALKFVTFHIIIIIIIINIINILYVSLYKKSKRMVLKAHLTYLILTYLFSYLLTRILHGAESFLRS